jgi:hypothetical protein
MASIWSELDPVRLGVRSALASTNELDGTVERDLNRHGSIYRWGGILLGQ